MIGLSELNGMDFGTFWVVTLLLVLFSIGFNQLINYLHRTGYNDGKTWLEVVFGVAIVILASGFTLGAEDALVLFFHFAAAGSAMVLGDIWRHTKARRREVEDQKEL